MVAGQIHTNGWCLMRTVFHWLRALSCWVICLLGTTIAAGAEEPSHFHPDDGHPAGVVVGISGGSASIVSEGLASRALKIGDRIVDGDELSIGGGAKVDVLWDHRALLTLQAQARLKIQEPHRGQTDLQLRGGSMRIALSYNAGRMTDKLTLQTAFARVVSRGGILEASVVKADQRPLFARMMNAPSVDTFRVLEGQARIEPLSGEGKPFSIKAGSEASLTAETIPSISEMSTRTSGPQPPLAAKTEHRESPVPITRQIIHAHVGLALESEKELQRIATGGNEVEQPGSSTKGVILATSTGVPSFPSVQAFGGGSVSGTSTASASSAAVPSPAGSVSVSGAGAAIGSAQSGGLNSSGLLKQLLNEVGKGAKGKDKNDRGR